MFGPKSQRLATFFLICSVGQYVNKMENKIVTTHCFIHYGTCIPTYMFDNDGYFLRFLRRHLFYGLFLYTNR